MITGEFSDCFAGLNSARKGKHHLSGNVAVESIPAQRKVSVYDRKKMSWVASTLSDPETGEWSISCIPEFGDRGCFVIAQDPPEGIHNAQIFDFVSQYDPNPTVLEEAVGGE